MNPRLEEHNTFILKVADVDLDLELLGDELLAKHRRVCEHAVFGS